MAERDSQHGMHTGSWGQVEPRAGDRLCGWLELIEELGRGGMGQVWKARDLESEKPRVWAVKMLPSELRYHPDAVQQVGETFDRIHALKHDAIGKTNVLRTDPTLGPFVVMDLIPGQPLQRYARNYRNQHGSIPLAHVVRLLRPVAEALDYAHRNGVVHRDVKPPNILVGDEPKLGVTLIDFGLAAEVRTTMRTISRQRLDTQGTLPYMSPEQLKGKRPPQMDQYALAVVAYELLAGHLPLDSEITEALLQLIYNELPDTIPGIPDSANAALLKAMAKKPEERFASCVEFIRELAGDLAVPQSIIVATVVPPPFPTINSPPVGPPIVTATRARPLVAPFDANVARAGQEAWAAQLGLPVEYTNSIGMKFRLIPPGEFLMGGEKHGDEQPVHKVRLTIPFYLGVYPVTQGEYEQVMGNNPSQFTGDQRLPVENVSWEDAQEFLSRLTTANAGNLYRLPTEAEWEYTCRAGTTTEYWFGDALNGDLANVDGTQPYGTNRKGPYAQRTTRVETYRANPFGLYDQHGNVFEWCADWYDENFYAGSPEENPVNDRGGSYRVDRGGCWGSLAVDARAALRSWFGPGDRYNNLGFRAALVPTSLLKSAEPKVR